MVHSRWTSGRPVTKRSHARPNPRPQSPARPPARPTRPYPLPSQRLCPMATRCRAGSRPRLLHSAREEHRHDVQLSTRMPTRKVISTRSEWLCSKFRPRLHQVVDLATAASTLPASPFSLVAGRRPETVWRKMLCPCRWRGERLINRNRSAYYAVSVKR